jgi:hypothetical protein
MEKRRKGDCGAMQRPEPKASSAKPNTARHHWGRGVGVIEERKNEMPQDD